MFHEDTRKQACELVEYIMQSHYELVRDIFNTMPSLASIPILYKHEATLNSMKETMDVRSHFLAFIRRCQSDTATVVEQSLRELVPYLSQNEEFIHRSVLSEIPDPVVAQLARSLLDCCVKFNTSSDVITKLSAECLGLIGCLDPNRVDTVKEKKGILVLSNFDSMEETFDFILFFLQNVLVETFLSASNTRAQGFLAYAMQNLLRFCGLDSAVANRSRDFRADEKYQRWLELPETVRNILAPFLTSKYTVTIGTLNTNCSYPLFTAGLTHGNWLRSFVQDLLQAGNGDNAKLVFSVCSRIVKGQDISIASFLLPFAVLNRTVSGSAKEKEDLRCELVNVLSHPLPDTHDYVYENIILCSQVSIVSLFVHTGSLNFLSLFDLEHFRGPRLPFKVATGQKETDQWPQKPQPSFKSCPQGSISRCSVRHLLFASQGCGDTSELNTSGSHLQEGC